MSRTPKPSSFGPTRADTFTNFIVTAGVLLAAACAFALSFHGLSGLGRLSGMAGLLPFCIPLTVDGFQLAASGLVVARTRMGRSARGAWTAVIVSTITSGIGNAVAAHVMYGYLPKILANSMIAVGAVAPIFLAWTFHQAVRSLDIHLELVADRQEADRATAMVPAPAAQVPADGPEPVDHLDHPVDQSTEQVPDHAEQVPAAPVLYAVADAEPTAPVEQVPAGPVDLASMVRMVLDQWTAAGRAFGPEDWSAVVKAAPALAGKSGYSRPAREIPRRITAYLTAKSLENKAA